MAEEGTPPLTYEETPIIDPKTGKIMESKKDVPPASSEDMAAVIPEATRVFGPSGSREVQPAPGQGPIPQEVPPSMASKSGGKRNVGTILFIVLLFGLGVWLSSQLRSFFAPAASEEVAVPTLVPLESISPPLLPEASPSGAPGRLSWQTYEVMSGATKQAIPGITYQLPSEVKAPLCDGARCASSGTNLPGGTRFTVAARGQGQLLPDFRGAILTDAAGREFTMKQTLIGASYAYEYTGDFTGRTGGGYTFTKIRGALMPVSETLAIEFNHFAPAGITADFETDDLLFDEIIKTFTSGAATSLPIVTPTITPATTSGY